MRARHDADVVVPRGAIEQLGEDLRGDLLTPGAPGYDEARTVWNAMIERRPALIARCAAADDAARAVRFAHENDLLVSVRGGGHNVAGSAVVDGGLMIDLSAMRSVRVDADRRTARAEPGATLGDLDRATQAAGLATPLGISSTTGVAGLTLGGGLGWLTRRHGMTIDNLLAAELVLADGGRVRASEREKADLFWGLRGGGGNLGVVTSFEFRLHPVGPEVLAGMIVHAADVAADVLRFYRDFAVGLGDETAVFVVLRLAPPVPFLPQDWHGKPVVVLAAFHAGDHRTGERALEPLRGFGRPIADVIGPKPFVGWQQALDPMLAPGARNYWKSHDFTVLDDAALDTIVSLAARQPAPESDILIFHVGGAAGRVPPDATAYPHRGARFVVSLHARWRDHAGDAGCIAWARDGFRALAPHATGGVYVNFLAEDEAARVRAAYGPNFGRMLELKNRYDPTNLFQVNHNIRPTVAS